MTCTVFGAFRAAPVAATSYLALSNPRRDFGTSCKLKPSRHTPYTVENHHLLFSLSPLDRWTPAYCLQSFRKEAYPYHCARRAKLKTMIMDHRDGTAGHHRAHLLADTNQHDDGDLSEGQSSSSGASPTSRTVPRSMKARILKSVSRKEKRIRVDRVTGDRERSDAESCRKAQSDGECVLPDGKELKN